MAKGKFQKWLTHEGLLKIEGWAKDGLTDEQIAHNIGITRETLNQWCKRFSDISDTLKRGKEVVDREVENALLKRALGYKFTEVTKERVIKYDPTTGEATGSHLVVTKEVEKEVQPDTTAQIFWLKNRKPEQWRDKRDVELDAEVRSNNPFQGLSTEELRRYIEENE